MRHVSEETLIQLREKCEKVQNLLEEESKYDPETEPYKSKYAAREILSDMKSTLANIKDNIRSNNPLFEQIEAMYGAVLLMIGTVSVDTEELSTAEEHLMKCLKRLEDNALHPKNIIIVLKALNQLGYLWSLRADAPKSHGYLQRAEQLYNDYTAQCEEQPVDVYTLFTPLDSCQPQTKAESPLEKVHTLTLYYLAQVYGTLGNPLKSAVYCHSTLKRQLEDKDIDMVEWALNSATLAQFFMEQNAFYQACHHLAAASYMIDKYAGVYKTDDCSVEEVDAREMRMIHRGADIARCWAKYCLVLLSSSQDRLMENEDALPRALSPPEELSGLEFSQLELTKYLKDVTYSYVLTYDDAREVFQSCQHWLTLAKLYYTLENHASDYVRIIQDHSEAYRNLIFFEDKESRQCRMHKRRADLLEGVVKELNPTYYLTACRELWFELGEIYSAMIDLKLSKLQDNSDAPSPQALEKINYLAGQAIAAYTEFLKSLKNHKTNTIPEVFSPDIERPALLVIFYLARLYSKLIALDKPTKVANLKTSLEFYKKIVEYFDRNKGAKDNFSAELSVSQDMVSLLPHKLAKLTEFASH